MASPTRSWSRRDDYPGPETAAERSTGSGWKRSGRDGKLGRLPMGQGRGADARAGAMAGTERIAAITIRILEDRRRVMGPPFSEPESRGETKEATTSAPGRRRRAG